MGWLAKILASVLIGIVVTSLLYWGVGTYLNVSGTAIEDGTPTQFSVNTNPWTFNIQVDNNAASTFPYLTPDYIINVTVSGNSNTFAYFIDSESAQRNFTNYDLSLENIVSGTYKSVDFFLNIDEGSSFMVKVTISVNALMNFNAASATYKFQYDSSQGEYSVTRI